MTTVKCRYCKKEIEIHEAAVVHQYNRNLYYCKEHRGLKTDGQWLLEILLNILGEQRLDSAIVKRIYPVTSEFGTRTVASYMHAHAKELKTKLEGEGKDGKIRSTRTKVNYLLSILNGELPKYHPDRKPENNQSLNFYDPTSIDTPVECTVTRSETLDEKRARLLKVMDQPDEDEGEFVDFCSFILEKQEQGYG